MHVIVKASAATTSTLTLLQHHFALKHVVQAALHVNSYFWPTQPTESVDFMLVSAEHRPNKVWIMPKYQWSVVVNVQE